MPVLRGGTREWAEWCELEAFASVAATPDSDLTWRAGYPANKLVVVEGACTVATPDGERRVERGGTCDVPTGDYAVRCDEAATWVWLGGHWGEDCGGSGVFEVARAEKRRDTGDPVDYPKHTNFDRHYHDCDEYWIVVSGAGTAYSEGVAYDVGPGDCVATRMGDHHDFPLVDAPVRAVYFETTMKGERRRGHLWEHTHGPARMESG